jgi:hypothetical protein
MYVTVYRDARALSPIFADGKIVSRRSRLAIPGGVAQS